MLIVKSWRHWLLLCAIALVGWTLLALVFGTQSYAASLYRGRAVTWWGSVTYPGVYYLIWAALTPLVYALATRVPPDGRRVRFLAVHLGAGLGLSLLHAWLFVAIMPRVQPGIWSDASANQLMVNALVSNVHSNLLIYGVLVATTLGLDLYARYRERELRTSQLEARLAQAELQTLKAQLQPHFLFNTLHAISALVHEDPEAADRTIARLADLLRMTLESHGEQEVSLRREVEFLHHYLEIEQTRLGDRLRVAQRIEDASLEASVPALILQPLVENAIRHGVASRAEGGSVTIRAARENGALVIEVRDDGRGSVGSGAGEGRRDGVGLANTRARLAQLYGVKQRLDVTSEPERGFAVTLTIPFRETESF